jgi:hypothetical protein
MQSAFVYFLRLFGTVTDLCTPSQNHYYEAQIPDASLIYDQSTQLEWDMQEIFSEFENWDCRGLSGLAMNGENCKIFSFTS